MSVGYLCDQCSGVCGMHMVVYEDKDFCSVSCMNIFKAKEELPADFLFQGIPLADEGLNYNVSNYTKVWNILTSPVYARYSVDGKRQIGMVRHLIDDCWLYVDLTRTPSYGNVTEETVNSWPLRRLSKDGKCNCECEYEHGIGCPVIGNK